MSGQYNISEELLNRIKKEVKETVQNYIGDLFLDNDITITVSDSDWKDCSEEAFKPHLNIN